MMDLVQGLSILTQHLGTGSFFVVGDCPVHCRVLSNIPGLYSLEASSIPSCDNQKYLQTLPPVPWKGGGHNRSHSG